MPIHYLVGEDIEVKKLCAVCNVTSDACCKSCFKAYYCCRQHQISDWKKHKLECFPVTPIKCGSERYLVATRDIKQGERILKEKPFIICANVKNKSDHTCLGCCKMITAQSQTLAQQFITCSKCKWYMCSRNCEKMSLHTDYECEILSKNDILPSEEDSFLQKYCEIAVLRCLLTRNKNPEIWQQLMTLNDHADARKFRSEIEFSVEELTKFIREECQLTEFNDTVIDSVFGILRGNSFDASEAPFTIRNHRYLNRRASLLFQTTVIPGPSCIPNGRWALAGREDGNYMMIIGAAIDIKKGECINCSYEDSISGTLYRRQMKQQMFFQNCSCERCSDPTELGSHISSIKCAQCQKGYCVQEDPLVVRSDWKCLELECSSIIEHDSVLETVNSIIYELNNVPEMSSEVAVENLETIIKKYSGSILHANHFLMLNAQFDLCQRLLTAVGLSASTTEDWVTLALGKKIVESSQSVLEITDVICPGHNRIRGRLLYGLQVGMVIILSDMMHSNRFHCRKLSEGVKRYRRKKCDETKEIQQEALKILEFEPEDSEESRMVKALKIQIQDVAAISIL